MKKIIFQILALIGLIILLAVVTVIFKIDVKNIFLGQVENDMSDVTYMIDGESLTLKDDLKYFGNDVRGDFDGDGREDKAFIVTRNSGGSGTFFYVVVRLDKVDGAVGSEGFLLGDRIAPQNINLLSEIDPGKLSALSLPVNSNIIVVNYVDHAPGESFVVSPSIGKTKWLLLDTNTMQWGEVAVNFEGEADTSRMTLTMNAWKWQNTIFSDGKVVSPNKSGVFGLTFKEDSTVAISTDCNSGGGNYVSTSNTFMIKDIISTLMYCDGSQETEYFNMLNEVEKYEFTSKGELKLFLKGDKGIMYFR